MEYNPNSIIQYTNNHGPKKKHYGIITGQPNSSCVDIFTELKSELSLFLDPETSTSFSKIEKILSLEDFSKVVKKDYSEDRDYLLKIKTLLESHPTLTINSLLPIIN